MHLIWPTLHELPSYLDALARGWQAGDTEPESRTDIGLEFSAIHDDPEAFLAAHRNEAGLGAAIILGDGTLVPRLPSIRRWLWDGEFCGVICFRWLPGTEALPAHVLGHIGYAVVPWKRQLGYATEALRLILPEAQVRHLRYVDLSTSPHNLASQRVIQHNGGVFVEAFVTPDALGAEPALRFRIALMQPGRRARNREG